MVKKKFDAEEQNTETRPNPEDNKRKKTRKRAKSNTKIPKQSTSESKKIQNKTKQKLKSHKFVDTCSAYRLRHYALHDHLGGLGGGEGEGVAGDGGGLLNLAGEVLGNGGGGAVGGGAAAEGLGE